MDYYKQELKYVRDSKDLLVEAVNWKVHILNQSGFNGLDSKECYSIGNQGLVVDSSHRLEILDVCLYLSGSCYWNQENRGGRQNYYYGNLGMSKE